MFNSIVDRALSEHRGSALLIKKTNGLFSMFLPVEGTGENGSAPETLEKTAIGNLSKTYEEGRTDNPQITIPFYAHRDNLNILEEYKDKEVEFLRLLPDFTGYRYNGKVNYRLTNTDVGGLEQGEMTITVTSAQGYIDNCYALIEDTAMFTSAIPSTLNIVGTGKSEISITTNPADATVEVVSGTEAVATVTYSEGKVTITGVTAGTSVVTITVSKTGYASFKRTILVIDTVQE